MSSELPTNWLMGWAGAAMSAQVLLGRAMPPPQGVAVFDHHIGPEPASHRVMGGGQDNLQHFLRLAHRTSCLVAEAGGRLFTSGFMVFAYAGVHRSSGDLLFAEFLKRWEPRGRISCARTLADALRGAAHPNPAHRIGPGGAVMLSTGRHVVAAALGSGSSIFVFEGACPEYERGRWRVSSTATTPRGTLIATRPLSNDPGWWAVPPEHLVIALADGSVRVEPALTEALAPPAAKPFTPATLVASSSNDGRPTVLGSSTLASPAHGVAAVAA